MMSSAHNGMLSISDNQQLLLDHKPQLIYCASQFKHVDLSLAQAQAIIDYATTEAFNQNDIDVLLHLVDAFRFILINTNTFTFRTIQRINQLVVGPGVAGAGKLRTATIRHLAPRSQWVPPIPDQTERETYLIELLTSRQPVTDQAIDLFLDICRLQYFVSGNQRTALFAANNLLLSQGAGVLTIPADEHDVFRELLDAFCLSGDDEMVKQWLYELGLVN
ncbi:Fic family protein [Secundilactobacillus paracollinoides]|uniref:Fic family protein n=1 Tax=Secundilactobacillus paracollinoides TaxID=240427 RepID=UPI003F480755